MSIEDKIKLAEGIDEELNLLYIKLKNFCPDIESLEKGTEDWELYKKSAHAECLLSDLIRDIESIRWILTFRFGHFYNFKEDE